MGAQDFQSLPPKVQSPTEAATMSIDPTIAPYFTWVPTQAETVNVLTPGKPDQIMTWEINTVGAASFNVTPGTNTRSQGVLATGTTTAKRFIIVFKSNGTIWNEISRTAAM